MRDADEFIFEFNHYLKEFGDFNKPFLKSMLESKRLELDSLQSQIGAILILLDRK